MAKVKVMREVEVESLFEVGDPVWYRMSGVRSKPEATTITRIGSKSGEVVYDNDLSHWGYEHQYNPRKTARDKMVALVRRLQRLASVQILSREVTSLAPVSLWAETEADEEELAALEMLAPDGDMALVNFVKLEVR